MRRRAWNGAAASGSSWILCGSTHDCVSTVLGDNRQDQEEAQKKSKPIWWIPLTVLKLFCTSGSYARNRDTSPICCSFPLHVRGAFLSQQTSHKSQFRISSPAARRFHACFLRAHMRDGDGDAGEARAVLQARGSAPGPSCEALTGSCRCCSTVHELMPSHASVQSSKPFVVPLVSGLLVVLS